MPFGWLQVSDYRRGVTESRENFFGGDGRTIPVQEPVSARNSIQIMDHIRIAARNLPPRPTVIGNSIDHTGCYPIPRKLYRQRLVPLVPVVDYADAVRVQSGDVQTDQSQR